MFQVSQSHKHEREMDRECVLALWEAGRQAKSWFIHRWIDENSWNRHCTSFLQVSRQKVHLIHENHENFNICGILKTNFYYKTRSFIYLIPSLITCWQSILNLRHHIISVHSGPNSLWNLGMALYLSVCQSCVSIN